MPVKELSLELQKEFKRVKKKFKEDRIMSRLAGLSHKVKETVEPVQKKKDAEIRVLQDYPVGTKAIFLPLSRVSIPEWALKKANTKTKKNPPTEISAKTRKLFPHLIPVPVVLTTEMTKSLNFQTNILNPDFTENPDAETCRAPYNCFVVPRGLSPELLEDLATIIKEEELVLQNHLTHLFGSDDTTYLEPGKVVYFYPRTPQDISKVKGLCMVGRIYEATYQSNAPGGIRMAMGEGDDRFEFLVKRGTYCCSATPDSFLKAQTLTEEMEIRLMERIQTHIDNDDAIYVETAAQTLDIVEDPLDLVVAFEETLDTVEEVDAPVEIIVEPEPDPVVEEETWEEVSLIDAQELETLSEAFREAPSVVDADPIDNVLEILRTMPDLEDEPDLVNDENLEHMLRSGLDSASYTSSKLDLMDRMLELQDKLLAAKDEANAALLAAKDETIRILLESHERERSQEREARDRERSYEHENANLRLQLGVRDQQALAARKTTKLVDDLLVGSDGVMVGLGEDPA